jgi:hypothetical protein
VKTLKVKQLRAMLEGVPDNAPVVFQANVPDEEDKDGAPPSHTTAIGTVYSVFARNKVAGRGTEFVIDGAVTEQE